MCRVGEALPGGSKLILPWPTLLFVVALVVAGPVLSNRASAAEPIDVLIAGWQEEWQRTAAIRKQDSEEVGLDTRRVAVRLAALAGKAMQPGQDPFEAAFALSALHTLLSGTPLDALLLEALDAEDPTIRLEAASAMPLLWERNRVVCPNIGNPPEYCPGTGIFYREDGVSTLMTQMQKVIDHRVRWPFMRTLTVMRAIASVLGDVSTGSDELAASLVQSLFAEPEPEVRRYLGVALNAYLSHYQQKGVDVLVAALKGEVGVDDPALADRLGWLVLPVEPYDAGVARLWVEVLDKLENEAALPALGYLVRHPSFSVAWNAAATARWIVGEDRVVPVWIRSLSSDYVAERYAAAMALDAAAEGLPRAVALQVGEVAPYADEAVANLLSLLGDDASSVRAAAARALAAFALNGTEVPLSTLIAVANDRTVPEDVRARVARAVAGVDPASIADIDGGDVLVSLHQLTPVYRSGTEGYHTFRIPAVIVTPRGTVLAFAEGRRWSASDTGDIDLVVKRSTDGGLTWGPVQVIWDSGPHTSGNPVPVVDEDTGRIWLYMTHNLGQDTEAEILAGTSDGIRTIWLTYSDDDGLTWVEPTNMFEHVQSPDTRGDGTGPGIGIQLRHGPNKGRLVIPAQGRVLYSDDHGATWTQGSRAPHTNESQVVELSDGRLLRNDRPAGWTPGNAIYSRRALTVSKDQGLTWGTTRYAWELVTPYVQGSTIRYVPADTDGPEAKILIFANPDHETDRVNMSVWVSADDGESWPFKRRIHGGPSAYSSLTVLPNGTIGLLFEGGNDRPYENLYWTMFSLDWLMSESTEIQNGRDSL